jgi:tetratricopeptide (TPR) repeat protein
LIFALINELMKTTIKVLQFLSLMFCLSSATLSAQSASVTQAVALCDKLAAHPEDKAKPTGMAGVAFDDLDGSAAKSACEKALAVQPSPRMHYQLGRALEVLGDLASARKHLQIAAKANYVRAFTQLGSTYDTDEANNPEGHIAFSWYKRGAEMGDAQAMFNVATCLYRGHCADENVPQALEWYKKSAAAGYQDAQDWVDILTEELAE